MKLKKFKKIKKVFLDIVSFNTPEAIVFNLTSILVLLRIFPKSPWNTPSLCVFKNFIFPLIFRGHCPTAGIFAGCNCPACGMTRAMSRLVRGDIVGAYAFNKGVFLVFIGMIVVIIVNMHKIIKKS